ncbi:MAG: fumarate hydratase [Candidatus Promineifilaceae bacterium]|nr:fumarate hydratase [Candidatus Promineifilaceae bacterium]
MLRQVPVSQIEAAVIEAIERSAYELPADYLRALSYAREQEHSPLGQSILLTLLENSAYAQDQQIATCQDTGMAIIHMTLGQDVHLVGGDINQALNSAVARAYKDLRKSVVSDPLLRQNSGDNTPPIVSFQIVPGSQVQITVMMKGFGAELMSRLRMFPPAAGVEGVKEFLLETVEKAGPNACPPVIIGVGLGSSFDGVAALAKKALLRPLGTSNPKPHLEKLEREWLEAVNNLGIGPQGFGGTFTALAVHIESYPTHIAALPAAVNLNCSAPRRATVTI